MMGSDCENDVEPPGTSLLFMKYRTRVTCVQYLIVAVVTALLVTFIIHYNNDVGCSEKILFEHDTRMTLSSDTATSNNFNEDTRIEVASFKVIEDIYRSTLRSCLGSYCLDKPFTSKSFKNDVIRVGILFPEYYAPLESVRAVIEDMIVGISDKNAFEIVSTSNVPPYGYGRNHGWSKMIRLIDQIPTQTTRLLSIKSQTFESNEEVAKTQMKQLIRWQCRLNHVAAHSSMLSVFVEDLLDRPYFFFQQILSFLNINADRDKLLSSINKHFPTLKDYFYRTARRVEELDKTTLLLSTQVMKEELENSKNLQRWPCKSFKELEKKSALSEQLPIKYYQIAANCSAPYVKCTVPYDIREQPLQS